MKACRGRPKAKSWRPLGERLQMAIIGTVDILLRRYDKSYLGRVICWNPIWKAMERTSQRVDDLVGRNLGQYGSQTSS